MSPGEERALGWRGWTGGYFASRVGKHGNEARIKNYVKEQGRSIDSFMKIDSSCFSDTSLLAAGFFVVSGGVSVSVVG